MVWKKLQTLLLLELFHWSSCVRCFVCNKRNLNLRTTLTTCNNVINTCVITLTKPNCTSAQRIFNWNTSVTNRERTTLYCANNCQGQLQTPQSVSVHSTSKQTVIFEGIVVRVSNLATFNDVRRPRWRNLRGRADITLIVKGHTWFHLQIYAWNEEKI